MHDVHSIGVQYLDSLRSTNMAGIMEYRAKYFEYSIGYILFNNSNINNCINKLVNKYTCEYIMQKFIEDDDNRFLCGLLGMIRAYYEHNNYQSKNMDIIINNFYKLNLLLLNTADSYNYTELFNIAEDIIKYKEVLRHETLQTKPRFNL